MSAADFAAEIAITPKSRSWCKWQLGKASAALVFRSGVRVRVPGNADGGGPPELAEDVVKLQASADAPSAVARQLATRALDLAADVNVMSVRTIRDGPGAALVIHFIASYDEMTIAGRCH